MAYEPSDLEPASPDQTDTSPPAKEAKEGAYEGVEIEAPEGWNPPAGDDNGEATVEWRRMPSGSICITSFDGHPVKPHSEAEEKPKGEGMGEGMMNSMSSLDGMAED